MKLFSVNAFETLFITIVMLTATAAFDEAHQLNDAAISTRSPHETRQSDSCVGQCAFSFVDSMRNEFGNGGDGTSAGILNLNYNDFLTAFSNATFFEKFCGMYHKFNYCYMQCPHGYMQELLQRSSEIVDHFCVYNYKAIMEKFGCLSSLDQKVSKACLKTCTSKHEAVTSLMHNFRQLALNGDSTQAEHYLAESCEYVICTLHCDVPMIAHMCDFETANLVINLTKKSFDSMQRMALDTGAVSKWPAMCADIKTYALPKSPTNPPLADALIAQSPTLHNIADHKRMVARRDENETTSSRQNTSKISSISSASFSLRLQLWWWPLVIASFRLFRGF